jgi:tetratricopeptide (TPR) repeat protein
MLRARTPMNTHDVFLSSAFTGFKGVRQRIVEIDSGRIWAVEGQRRPDLDQRKGASPFFIVDELIAQVRRSNLVICVLRDVYGSSVFGSTESVSFLETEIYQAALFHNNVRFFFMEPFNPPEKLKGLLELVRAMRPDIIPERALPEQAVVDEIKRALERTPSKRRPWAISLRRFVGELAFRRGHPNPDLEFFDKVFRPVSAKPDRDHIRELLDQLSGEQSIEKRLTRTWIALRELSAAPYDDTKFREYLPLWNDVLGIWSSAAAWYGLHGHLYAGRLAAVNSQLAIRGRMDWAGADRSSAHYIQGTKGARASEYYSMAKLMPSRRQRDEYLQLARREVNDALGAIENDLSGYLSIRGHISLIENKLDEALADCEQSKACKEAARNVKGAAETQADIALVHMRRGNVRTAVTLLREGVTVLEDQKSFTFAIRVRKRLAYALLRSGHPFQAWIELNIAHDMAVQNQVYDQITPTMEMANRLAMALGLKGGAAS